MMWSNLNTPWTTRQWLTVNGNLHFMFSITIWCVSEAIFTIFARSSQTVAQFFSCRWLNFHINLVIFIVAKVSFRIFCLYFDYCSDSNFSFQQPHSSFSYALQRICVTLNYYTHRRNYTSHSLHMLFIYLVSEMRWFVNAEFLCASKTSGWPN